MKTWMFAMALATGCMSAPAFAAVGPMLGGGDCKTDLTLGGTSTVLECYGRISGNALNNADNSTINTALGALGYDGGTISYNAVSSANILGLSSDKNATINFPGVLNGIAYVGIHTGGGGRGGLGNQTTFYKIDARDLDSFTLIASGGSTATLFATVAAVPEPATWAMMLLGFALVGASARYRRRSQKVTYA